MRGIHLLLYLKTSELIFFTAERTHTIGKTSANKNRYKPPILLCFIFFTVSKTAHEKCNLLRLKVQVKDAKGTPKQYHSVDMVMENKYVKNNADYNQ